VEAGIGGRRAAGGKRWQRGRVWLGGMVVVLAGCSEGGSPVGSLTWDREAGAAAAVERLDPVRVDALGHGRRWHFSYDGPDGVSGTGDDRVSTGELILPGNTEVRIHLRSRDFIYVFSCPELGLKEIAVPDLEFTLVFRTGGRGRYELAMDPMCGFPAVPGETMGVLRVVLPSDFRSWVGSAHRGPG
jgi:heme/copper-type cytochrome/quinol oxidase subunit 2